MLTIIVKNDEKFIRGIALFKQLLANFRLKLTGESKSAKNNITFYVKTSSYPEERQACDIAYTCFQESLIGYWMQRSKAASALPALESLPHNNHIKILVADGQEMVRKGFVLLLESAGYRVIGEAANGIEAVERAAILKPTVLLCDVNLPLLNGIEVARRIKKWNPAVIMIMLGAQAEKEYILRALQAGAVGYLLKSDSPTMLYDAIWQTYHGKRFLSADIETTVLEDYLERSAGDEERSGSPLTDREREVLQLIAEERTSTAIAALLGLSVKTVDNHRKNIMRKLDIHSKTGLVKYAIQQGVVSLANLSDGSDLLK